MRYPPVPFSMATMIPGEIGIGAVEIVAPAIGASSPSCDNPYYYYRSNVTWTFATNGSYAGVSNCVYIRR